MTRDEIVTAYTKRLSQALTTVEPREYWAVQSVLTAAIRDADLDARQELDEVIRKQAISLKAYEEEAIALVRRINHEKDRRGAALEEMVGLNQVISNLQAQNAKLSNENEEQRRSLELRALAIREAREDANAAAKLNEKLTTDVQDLNQLIAELRAELKYQRTLAQEANDERNTLIFRLNAASKEGEKRLYSEATIDYLRQQNEALRAEMKEVKLAAAYDEAVIEDARLAAVATIENQKESIKNLKANLVNRGHDIDRLREIKGEDEQAIATLRATVAALRENLDRTTKERDFAQVCLSEADGRAAALSKELNEEGLLRGQLAACRREANGLASQLIEARERNEQERKHLKAGLESCEAELNRVKVANQALADQIETARGWRHKLQVEHDHELARAVATFEGQIHGLVKERDAREAQFLKASNALVASERAAVSLSKQLVDMTLERDEVRAEINRLYEAYQGVAELQAERDSLRAELTRVTDGLTERITELRKERDAFRKQMDANDGLVRELAVERDSLKRKVARLEAASAAPCDCAGCRQRASEEDRP